jgi:hypothetical protein
MELDSSHIRRYLRAFDFKTLFVEELGWDRHDAHLDVYVDGQTFTLTAIAEKRGMVAFTCGALDDGRIPDYPTRRKIERQTAKSIHEHLIIYTNRDQATQIWQWVKRELGKPTACREHTYHRDQPGDALIQKLQSIAFSLEEEERLTIVDVTKGARTAFDVERVTKRFYDRFKTELALFLKFLKGIPDEDMQSWYASVMLNRLMFIYFIQKKGFLDNNTNYLRNKLAQSKNRGKDLFYSGFLCPLFFEGFAKKESERSAEANQLLGKVPYLNGGIFQRHQIEELHGEHIQIADTAFEKLFEFFDQYQWHLDERPLRADNEINPDVLGYIFEKYINQKQMGAYYTKEDITEYIGKNTVIPFLFDAARQKCKIAFVGANGGSSDTTIWHLLKTDPDRYIYEAVRRGVIDENNNIIPENSLPDFVQKGMHDPKVRMFDKRYNLSEAFVPDSQDNNLALPTETWREYVERRKRCLDLWQKLSTGEIRDINDLITYNLNTRQFAQDVIENCEGPELLRAFWHAVENITVLDPTCGSGAFLFAALNILEPLYEACLDRMEAFVCDLERSGEKHRPEKFSDLRRVLERVTQHPNRRYFVLKSIIISNLFGVDIMEEAVEICKLRLFLKLVAQIERVVDIEPLPDIDFNIRAGNTLVGFANYDEVKRAVTSKLDFDNTMVRIEEKAQDIDRLFGLFRQQQTEIGGEVTPADKQELRNRLRLLEDELNRYLASEYGVNVGANGNSPAYEKWLASHKPFHWFIEFYGIIKSGGFDVIIGNPPYVDYTKVSKDYTIRGYQTESCGNLYAFVMERALEIMRQNTYLGMIVPVSSVSGESFSLLRELLLKRQGLLSSYSNRPSKLFQGVEQRLTICILKNSITEIIFTSPYQHWYESERQHLFSQLLYVVASYWKRTGVPIKSGSKEAESAFAKITKCADKPLVSLLRNGSYAVWLHDGPTYWVRCLPFEPNTGSKSAHSNHYHNLPVQSKADARFLAAILSSSTFYFFFKMISNCRDLGRKEWSMFPLGQLRKESIEELGRELEKRLRSTATKRSRKYPSGIVQYEEYYPVEGKAVIDSIDRALAQHYGFTDEELDFIINYDIKYRMGRDAEGDEEV